MIDHAILISLKTFSSQGTSSMKAVLSRLTKNLKITSVSSVYKVDRVAESFAGLRDIRKEERLEGYAMVIRGTTTLPAQEVLELLTAVESEFQKEVLRRSVSLNLLTYDRDIIMLPGLALPHPEMHLRPEEVVPAVEVWGDYMHPVLNLSLAQLSQRFANDVWGEFFAQGTTLLDF